MKKNLINNISVAVIALLQFGYLLMFYLKNQLYLNAPVTSTSSTSISQTVFQKLQTYDTIANIILTLLACVVVFYCGYALLKVKDKQIIIRSLIVMSILLMASVIFYLMFLKNIYYDILINPLVCIGLLIIILSVILYKIRKRAF